MEISEVVERIGFFRNKKNLSAVELSMRIGMHESYINKLESKAFNLPVEMLLRIIEALEITPQIFFAENYANFETDDEIVSAVKKLPPEKKTALLKFLQ